jgi:hypothetical protein
LQPQADFLLDELFALGVLLVCLWLIEEAGWTLAAALPLLAAAMLTKREGYMFAACLLAAALLVTFRQRRASWPRLIVLGLLAGAATIPWRVLLAVRDLGADGPEAGGSVFSNFDRAWPSFRLALSTLFDFHIWLAVVPLLVFAIALAFASGAHRLPTFAALLCLFCVAGLTWSTWAFPSFPITKEAALNPIVRVSGGLVVSAAVLIPLLLARIKRRAVSMP